MSSRGEQIVARLFVKVALLISDARLTNREPPPATAKIDKWFQLEVRDDGAFASLAQDLREFSSDGGGPLELRVRTVLVLPHLAPPSAQALVLLPEPSLSTATTTTRRVRVNMPPTARAILLEEWSLQLDRSSFYPQQIEDPYPGIYKQAIALIRSLFALLRYVPTWQLHRKLGSGAPMQITVGATLEADPLDEDILGLEHTLVPDDPGPSTFSFPPIATPLGAITLRVRYRPHVRFRLDPLENLWSSAFASGPPSPGAQPTVARRQGAGPSNSTSPTSPSPPTPARGLVVDLDSPAFTPTLLATRQRASLTGSGSPLRPASRTGAGAPSTTPTIGSGLPPIRPRTVSQLSSGGEPGSPRRGVLGMGEPASPRRTVYDLLPRSPPASPRLGVEPYGGEGGSGLSRTRRESLLSAGAGRMSGSNTPFGATGGTGLMLATTIREGAAGDMPPPSPRRPSSTINPFRGPTLASSPRTALGSNSPLGIGGSPRTTPGLGLGTSPRSGLGAGAVAGSDGRRSLDSGGGGAGAEATRAQPQPINRYDTSFGHRAARSQGSLGSGGAGGGAGSAGTGTGVPGSLGAATGGTGGSVGNTGAGGPGSVGAASTGSGGQHTRLATIEQSRSYASQFAHDEELGEFIALIDGRPQLGLDVAGTGTERRTSTSALSRPPLSALGTETEMGIGSERFPLASPIQERLPLGSPVQDRLPLGSPIPGRLPLGEPEPTRAERFPPSSLPARYSALPPVSPDVPRPLPPPLQSIPPSPAESAWPLRSRDRSASRERGPRGFSRERFGDAALSPLAERTFGDRVRAMSLADRPPSTIRERHERERTTSFARRMLTNRDEVEAAVQLMTASFQASFAPPSPGTPTGHLAESSGGRRQIGNDEIVGRLELGGSGSIGGRSGGSMRPGRDTDTWREGGEWDQRMGGWR
ncbi:hypothetical protein FRC06_006654 [Ceratobasidium sp. 370]|nr:hypothetical protein FRC06_006654 [Ceratobasidium sp. 370]